jgi:polyisoprenoid-binding protein YceI
MKFKVLPALAAALLAVPALAAPTRYDIDPVHSNIGFSVKHMMVTNVRGEFSGVKGTVDFDAKNPAASKVEATVDAATIDTRDPNRDKHLKSDDFFAVEKHPTLQFKSKKFIKDGAGWKIVGDLTMKGVTKEVTLTTTAPTPEVKDPMGNQRLGVSATTKVNRKDFGINWNKAMDNGGVVVGNDVQVNLDLSLVKAAAAKTN